MKKLLFILLVCFCFISSKIFAQNEVSSVNDLMQKGQYAQALSLLEKLNIGDSTANDLLEKQAFCNYKLGRLNDAKKLYNSVLQRNPQNVGLLLQLATIHEKDFNLLEAFKSYSDLYKIDSSNTFYIKELSRISVRMEKAKLAILYLEKAVKLDNNDLESLTSLANLYLNIPKDDLAKPLIKRAFELDSTSIKTRHLRSRLAYRGSDFKEVIREIEFTMALGDSSSYYQRLLGTSYYHENQNAQSIVTFKRLIAVGEDKENVRAGLGYALLKSTENDQKVLFESIHNFNEARSLGMSDYLTDYEIASAEAQIKLGDIDLAIRNLGRLLHRPKAVFLLGEIYDKKKNDKVMALLYYQEYIKACGKQKKPTPDCNFIALATQRINELNPKLKLEIPKIMAQKDSVEVEVDTVRHD
jgi:tetratricopeptide (TPR) repeat protein